VTVWGKFVLRDGALRVVVVVNADANAKRRKSSCLLVLFLFVENRVSVSSSVLIQRVSL
jgi:hypothetical protein